MNTNTPPAGLRGKTVLVLGAGIVGICAALELQARGARVTVIDRSGPGSETSYGNAGVFARSSLFPINNPGLLSGLPGLLSNRRAGLRYRWPFLLSNPGWAARFLLNARAARFRKTARALDSLIKLSIDGHLRLVRDAGQQNRLSDQGWVFLYRSQASYDRSGLMRRTLQEFGVETDTLDADGLHGLEPALKQVFSRALWVKDTYSVNDPGALVQGYADLFQNRGGRIQQGNAASVREGEDAACVQLDTGEMLTASHAVVCLGPWGRGMMEKAGFAVPMGFERGYHRHFCGSAAPALTRPVYDTGGGYVLAPMAQGLRLSSGVELAGCEAPPAPQQLEQAEAAARQAIDLGRRIEQTPWLGRRPTFPDSRPVIGRAPGMRRLSVAFGHQHIGLSTGPGTARLLADMLEGRTPPIDAAPFSPGRFLRRRRASA